MQAAARGDESSYIEELGGESTQKGKGGLGFLDRFSLPSHPRILHVF